MEIVTGSTGVAHVTPIDDAVRNSNFGYYKDRIVFDTFRGLEAVAVTANEVRIYGGYGMNQGRLFKIDLGEYDSVTIENGTQGVKRSDLIVARYTMESQTGFEHIELAVIKGQSGNAYTDPVYTTGNINEGDTLDDFPLYRVKVNGIVIEEVEPLFTPTPDGGRLGVLEQRLNGKMRTDLGSEDEGYLDGSEHVKIGVEGVLPVSHGGTGANNKDSAINNLADGAGIGTNIFSDDDVFLAKSDRWYKKTIGNLWTYIRDKIQSFLGMGNTSIIPVAHGGTGKASITKGSVLVGDGTATPSEKGIDTTPTENSDNLITSGGVAEALTASGLGDMLKSTYDPNGDGIIDVQQGGIGNRGINSTTGGVSNSSALTTAGALYATVRNLQNSFQSGVDTLYNACVDKGVTPAASTPTAIAAAIGQLIYATGTKSVKNNGLYDVSAYENVDIDVAFGYPTKSASLMLKTTTALECLKTQWTFLKTLPFEIYAEHIWTDGENIYYSYNDNQYVLNKSTSTWASKTWNGLTSFEGDLIWTDGENIYYSAGDDQYVLNKSTSTWASKTWNGLSHSYALYGNRVWTDGENIYLSYMRDDQYVLNKSTSTWASKTWNGWNGMIGSNIWTDGENIYYSESSAHYILNKSTSTWASKTWNGKTGFNGFDVWTDGENIYYQDSYILAKGTSTWVQKNWGNVKPNRTNVWTDNEKVYCNYGTNQYVLNKVKTKWVV